MKKCQNQRQNHHHSETEEEKIRRRVLDSIPRKSCSDDYRSKDEGEDESNDKDDYIGKKIGGQETEKRRGDGSDGGSELEGLAMEGADDRVGD